MIKDYIINTKTSAISTCFISGYEYSTVIEGKESFIVCQSPDDIVKKSFLHVGNQLTGASESARYILKKKYKVPVALLAQKNIILIKCRSSLKDGTTWLINSHVKVIKPLKDYQTIVTLTDSQSLTVNLKTRLLQDKLNQAAYLQSILLERSSMNKTITYFYEKDKGMIPVDEDGQPIFIEKRNVESKSVETEGEVSLVTGGMLVD